MLKITYGSRNVADEVIKLDTVDDEISEVINKIVKENNYKKVCLVGYSLGAAVATRIVANRLINCTKLILISIFDDRQDLLKERSQVIIASEEIKPVDLVKKIIDIPIVFIHGSLDKSINICRAKRVFVNSNVLSSFISLPTDHSFTGRGLEDTLMAYLSDQL